MRHATHATALPTAIVLLVALSAVIAPGSAVAQDAPHTAHSMAWGREAFILADEVELRRSADGTGGRVDVRGWYGGANQRLWFGLDVEAADGAAPWAATAKYGQLLAPYWDLQVGLWAHDARDAAANGADGGVTFGFHGLAPGWFEVESAIRVSVEGDLTADLAVAYDLYLTQRLVADPHVEATWRARPLRESGRGAGVAEGALGVRLRYEWSRRFAPYVAYSVEHDRVDRPAQPLQRRSERFVRVGVRAWR